MILPESWTMKLKLPALTLTTILALGLGTAAHQAKADLDGWFKHTSDTGLFEMLFPKEDFQTKLNSLRLNDYAVAYYGTVGSVIDQRPYKDEVKKFSMHIEQTLGNPFTEDERSHLLLEMLEDITKKYKEKNGKVISVKKDLYQSGFPSGEIYMKYENESGKEQYLRAQVSVSDVSKFQQTLTAPFSSMNTYATRDFFGSTILHEGYSYVPGKVTDDWALSDSPLGIFSAYLPKVAFPYVPEAAKIENSNTNERMFMRFFDPVWKENIIFNLHGYILDRDLTYEHVIELLEQRHVLKHRFSSEKVTFQKLMENKVPMVQAIYKMTPPEGYEYVTNVKIKAYFYKNMVMVNEVMASDRMIDTPFAQELTRVGIFHPQVAIEKLSQKK